MAVVNKPLSAEDKKKIDKVIPDLEAAIDKIDTLQKCYEDAAATAQKFNDDRSLANTNVPWDITNANRRNAFEYIYSEPLQTIMSGQIGGTFINPDTSTSRVDVEGRSLSNTRIDGFGKNVRYDQIFNDHQHFIKGPANSLSNLLTEARTNLDTFNIVNYQSNLTNAKKLLVNQMIEPVRIFIQSIEVTNREITNPQSLFYKTGSAYGTVATFDPETISNFNMGSEMDSLREQAGEIFTKLRDLFNAIDALSKIKEDILKRVVLNNQGFKEDPNEPGTFNKGIDAKENWGIKFTYSKQFTSSEFIRTTGQNEALNNSLTQTRTRDANKQQALNNTTLRANQELLEGINLEQDRTFYMSLLPAIKSNLPVQGGVDVPGAMPGLQFRIENTIVKHKVPGFAPIYQPLGIDCIKCTIVGMFTGEDGVDFSDTLLKDLSTGLLADSTTLRPAKGGVSTTDRARRNTSPFLDGGALDYRNNPLVFRTGVDTPIPKNEKQQPNKAVLSEDAFSNAQEFYNEIVAPGSEITVEINTKGRSGGKTGGADGAFRDSETGNPFFKALVKRMDIYYVRQDRCYFILDLLITNSGLIGEECINLTNVIEEATELFEEVQENVELSVDELNKCFGQDPVREYKIKNGNFRDGRFKVNLKTGLSFRYIQSSNTLVPDNNTYPLNARGTINTLVRASSDKSLNRGAVEYVKDIQKIILNANSGIRKTSGERQFIASFFSYNTGAGGYFPTKFDTSTGLFFRFDNIQGRNILSVKNGQPITFTLEEVMSANNIAGDSSERLAALSEIASFMEFNKPNACQTTIEDRQKELEATQRAADTETVVDDIEILSINDIINNTNSSLTKEQEYTTPGTLDSPELRDRLDTADTNLLTPIEKGDLDESLISAVNDYLSLISTNEDAPPISNNTLLTTDLINTVKRNATYRSEETGKIRELEVVSADLTGSGLGDEQVSNTIYITARARVNGGETFIVKSGTRTQSYPGITFAVFNLQLIVSNGGEKTRDNTTYRVKSIKLNVPNFSTPSTTTSVETAPTDISPGDTNTPVKP